jgi:23S rRNA (pseudouridine1915-N3)-methyltransferase
MLKIEIRAIGRLHEPWKGLMDEYAKRLKPYSRLTITELPDAKFRSVDERDKILRDEASRLTKNLPHGARIIAMSERGKEMSTQEFARFVDMHDGSGQEIVFLIGGPLGIGDDALAHADRTLSLSRLTFTHEMARVILLEQLYRATTIIKGKTYHY